MHQLLHPWSGGAQKVMESESKTPKICKKQDNQIPRERKCNSKKDKANNSLFGRGRGKTQLPNQLLSCNKNCLLLEYLDPKENAYFESQSLLGPYPKVLHRRLLFKLLHYRSMDKKLVLVFKKG